MAVHSWCMVTYNVPYFLLNLAPPLWGLGDERPWERGLQLANSSKIWSQAR